MITRRTGGGGGGRCCAANQTCPLFSSSQLLRMPDARSVVVDPNASSVASGGNGAADPVRRPPTIRRSFSASCTPSDPTRPLLHPGSSRLRGSKPARGAPASDRGLGCVTRPEDGDASEILFKAESRLSEARLTGADILGSLTAGSTGGTTDRRRSFGTRVIDFLQNGTAVGRKAPPGLLPLDASAVEADSRSSDTGSDEEEEEGPAPPAKAAAAGALSLMAVTWQQRLAHSWPKVRGLTQSNSKLVGGLCGCCIVSLYQYPRVYQDHSTGGAG